MGLIIQHTPWLSGELANTSKFQTVIPNKNIILNRVRSQIILHNDPTFTDLTMKIYGNDEEASTNSPIKLLASSTTSWTKAQILTDNSGWKELYFNFSNFAMQENSKYNFVINGSGYSFGDDSYLSWVEAWPKPVHTLNYTPTTGNLSVSPFYLFLIGDEY